MSHDKPNQADAPEPDAADAIGQSARRKIKARKYRGRNALYGLGMFGLVGWAIAVPTILGTALGLWIDAHITSDRSWTIALLLGGVTLGCFNAWYWVSRESRDD